MQLDLSANPSFGIDLSTTQRIETDNPVNKVPDKDFRNSNSQYNITLNGEIGYKILNSLISKNDYINCSLGLNVPIFREKVFYSDDALRLFLLQLRLCYYYF